MLQLLIFYLIVVPICILLHEIGHGIGAVSSSNSHAHIYLGPRSEHNKENFRLGRLHFHISWSFIGFAYWDTVLTNRQRAIALAGGPLMSLILAITFGVMTFSSVQSHLHSLLWWTTIFTFSQFLVTIIPVTYPRWMGGYSGYKSDGLQLLRILRGQN